MFKTTIQRGITDNAKRKLIISPEKIAFENKDFTNNTFTIFSKDEIESYRFGINWMTYYFTFGREYVIEIKNTDGKVIKINFKTYFGRNVKQLDKAYANILDALWDYHFESIIDSYISLHKNGIPFTICNIEFTSEGITITVDNTLVYKKVFIVWDSIRTKNYYNYFAVFSENDAVNTNSVHSYKDDWNINLLYSVLRTILRDKKIENYD